MASPAPPELLAMPPMSPPSSPVKLVDQAAAIQVGLASGFAIFLLPLCCVLCLSRIRQSQRERRTAPREHALPVAHLRRQEVSPSTHNWTSQAPRPLGPVEKAMAETLERDRVAALRALPVFAWAGGTATGDECVLCMEGYLNGSVLRKLPCDHFYHKEVCEPHPCSRHSLAAATIPLTRHFSVTACAPSRPRYPCSA